MDIQGTRAVSPWIAGSGKFPNVPETVRYIALMKEAFMSMKKLLILAGVLALVAAFGFANGNKESSSAAAGSSSGTTTLNMWDFLSGGDGVRMGEIVDKFNSSQSKIQVKRTTLQWGIPFYTKVRTAIVAGQEPDVMTYHLSRYARAVPAGILTPITDSMLSSVGLSKSDFFPRLVEKATHNGTLYGVPLDTHPLILYYNKDILKQAGLLDANGMPKGIEGINNFTAALKAVKAKTGAEPLVMENNSAAYTPWRVWYTLLKQQGGSVIENGKVSIGAKGKAALEVMSSWAKDALLPQNLDYQTMVAEFVSGKAAFMLNGVWETPTLVDAQKKGKLTFQYGEMPVPKFYQNDDVWADSHSFVIPNSTKNPLSDTIKKADMQFIAFVEKNALIWAGGGHIPAYLPVVNSTAYQNLKPNVDYVAAAKHVVYDPAVPIGGAAGTMEADFVQFANPMLNGQLSVDQVISQFTQQLTQDLSK